MGLFIRLSLLMLLVACGTPATVAPATTALPGMGATLNVFAAASLTDAFKEIGAAFETANNAKVVFNFAGSQQLAQQIVQGAPVDVFASANKTQLNSAASTGRIITTTAQTFVRNRLVVVFPKANPGGITSLQDLTKPGLKLDLADKSVPVGQYSLDMLDKATKAGTYGTSFKDDVLKNVVSYEENVRSVLNKVTLGEADAGIVYTSDVALIGDQIGQLEIPDALNTIATYPIATLTDSPNMALAASFVAYVLGSEGQAVLVRYGFIAATP